MVLRVEEFRKYLKKAGKKDHVADDLVERCELFEQFLRKTRKHDMDSADRRDIMDYSEKMENGRADINNHLRAIALYYRFNSNPELSALASNLRSQRISLVKKAFKLENFKGVNKKHITLLEKEGIINADQMLEKGKTVHDRRELSKKTGIPLKNILEYVKLSDLSRIEGVKTVRARLYFDAGVDTLDKMASWNPAELRNADGIR